MTCIFGSSDQWASVKAIAPKRFEVIADYEKEFDCTIHRTKPVHELAAEGTSYESITPDLIAQAMSEEYTDSVVVDHWELPSGAFGESNGPT